MPSDPGITELCDLELCDKAAGGIKFITFNEKVLLWLHIHLHAPFVYA